MEMDFRDIASSHIKDDARLKGDPSAIRRVYSNFMYDVYLCVYPGIPSGKALQDDLITCMVTLKDEGMRIMFRISTAEIRGDRQRYIEATIYRMMAEGTNPFHLIRDAKKWCQIPFTLRDRAALRMANVDLDS